MKYRRQSIRLNGFDYAEHGYYFVTICLQNREKLFGEIKNNQMILNNVGMMVEKIVVEYFVKNKFIQLDEFVIMPDHVHIIIVIKNNNNVGAGLVPALNNNGMTNTVRATTKNTRAGIKPAPTDGIMDKTLGMVIGELKSLTTNEYIKNVKQNNWPRFNKRLWQRNYFERIIRNEKEYLGYKKYIKENPVDYD